MALATILSATALPALAQSKFEATGRPDPADDAGAYAEGEEATSAGESSNAIGDGASAFGAGALSFANWASAFGFNATAVGENALAVGSQSYAGAAGATAIGGAYVNWDGTTYYTQANDAATTSVGAGARSDYGFGVALGAMSWSEGSGAVAIGSNSHAAGFFSMAIGGNASTGSPFAMAIGSFSAANGWESAAFGNAALATDFFGTALGSTANATGVAATALGSYSFANGDGNTAVGYHSTVTDWNDEHADLGNIVVNGTAVGSESGANWEGAAVGYNAWARNMGSVAFGANAWAQSDYGVAIGHFAQVTSTGTNSVAIGAGSVADRANTVSVGASADWSDEVTGAPHTAIARQITNVAAGTQGTDAVNLDQLTTVETKADNAQATADAALNAAGTAQATADTALATANNAIGTAVSQSNAYTDQQVAGVVDTAVTEAKAVADAGDAATLASSHTYTDTKSTQTLHSANAYTDARFAAWDDNLNQIRTDVDHRLGEQDKRIDRQGAMGAAMLTMATSAAGVRTQNRVGVGIGAQRGQAALAIGYQRAISDRATVTFGGAVSGDDTSVGVGAGFGW
ncbi:YadA-like family protein [Lysobacter sp. KIS68-7]|uniref:YadA-like family protein n=1 Tax=Lysobacter sp. KIS68-7 TaxID=2904252 RepID=UPI001E3662A3|nr:YadA-like family protein [Lysobacter sp. KIS68-7]UHQ20176.1 YadA-like family protein [Lysobacter sp. KIS68-7]